MKKYIYLLTTIFLFASCTEDVKFNNPAFQTLKNNVFWRAQTYEAHISPSGKLVVTGTLGFDQIILQTVTAEQKTYTLGLDNVSIAKYYYTLDTTSFMYTTGANIGNGQITIIEYDIENKSISGTFKFKAPMLSISDSEQPQVSITEGVFYKVPVTIQTGIEM